MNFTDENVKNFSEVYKQDKRKMNFVLKWVTEELLLRKSETYPGCFRVDKKHDDLLFGRILFLTYIIPLREMVVTYFV